MSDLTAPPHPNRRSRRHVLAGLAGGALLAPAALPRAAAAEPEPGPPPATAARADAWVSAVQMPAWLERAGRREPLVAGTALAASDAVITGPGARVQLRLAEGSAVRLGESGRLVIGQLSTRRGTRIAVDAALEIARGAFRFTTTRLSRLRGERDLRVRIATVTAGVRGTDFWGRGTDEREIVCLIEGRIQVARDGEAPVEMSEARSFYIAPVGAPALPVAPVDDKQLAIWAADTALVPGAGATLTGGRTVLTVAESGQQDEALRVWDTLRAAGYAARIRPEPGSEGSLVYRVRIEQLASRAEAAGLAQRIAKLPGIAPPAP